MNPITILRRRWAVVSDTVSTQLWPVPVLVVVLAVVAGIGLARLDAHVDDSLPAWLTRYLFSGGADAARSVLGSIAGSLITVTSLTFSLTVVTLQLASSQFSPRLLRTFTRDEFVQYTLALFLGTFVFALTVLRTVRGSDSAGPGLVPQLSVTVAFVLAVASVLGLVLFLAHLVREIRVETMVNTVHHDATSTLYLVCAERDEGTSAAPVPSPPGQTRTLLAAASGFLTAVEDERLLQAVLQIDGVLMVHRATGSSVVAGTPVAEVWSVSGRLTDEDVKTVQDGLDGALLVGSERTAAQDIGYGLRQLTDVANKALSPGINDPTTAVHTLGHTSSYLCEAAGRQLGDRLLRDEQGSVRVVLAAPTLADLLELAVAQPRRYGAADADVLARLFVLLRDLAWVLRGRSELDAVRSQLGRLQRTAAEQDFDDTEEARLRQLGQQVEAAATGRWAGRTS